MRTPQNEQPSAVTLMTTIQKPHLYAMDYPALLSIALRALLRNRKSPATTWLRRSSHLILDVITIRHRRLRLAPIAIHFLHLVAGRVDHCRIDIGRENLNGPQQGPKRPVVNVGFALRHLNSRITLRMDR